MSSNHAFAGEWSRIDDQTIGFTGYLEPGEFQKFSSIFSPLDRELKITDSGGMVTEEGIKIGKVLANHDIKVTVTGYCMSSCANYLFTAGRQREIRNGIVGYHGNVKACFLGPKEQKTRDDLRKLFQITGKAEPVLKSRLKIS